MTKKKWKRMIQREMDKDLEFIMEQVNNDPALKDVVAPEEMHDKLFARIRAEEAERARLSDEEKELIRLGKVYKKRRKWNKYLVLVAAAVCALAIGVTSLGGPSKIIQRVQGMMDGKEQINVDTEDGRTEEVKAVSEVEAYEQIEEEFGFYPARLNYLPEDMEFMDVTIDAIMQNVQLSYQGTKQGSIAYQMYPNYRTGSIGIDVEDPLLEEYTEEVNGVTINVKKYRVEETKTSRYIVDYEYQDVYYLLQLINIEDDEAVKILENLFFE